jgi:hypothetical protein
MGQRSEPTGFNQVYILCRDHDGAPRGARFAVLKDSIVSAAMDMNCRVLIRQPEAVSALGMRLPIGAVCGNGKVVNLIIPIISSELYQAIMAAAQTVAQEERAVETMPHTIN